MLVVRCIRYVNVAMLDVSVVDPSWRGRKRRDDIINKNGLKAFGGGARRMEDVRYAISGLALGGIKG